MLEGSSSHIPSNPKSQPSHPTHTIHVGNIYQHLTHLEGERGQICNSYLFIFSDTPSFPCAFLHESLLDVSRLVLIRARLTNTVPEERAANRREHSPLFPNRDFRFLLLKGSLRFQATRVVTSGRTRKLLREHANYAAAAAKTSQALNANVAKHAKCMFPRSSSPKKRNCSYRAS